VVHPAQSLFECSLLLGRRLAPLMTVADAEDYFRRARRDWWVASHLKFSFSSDDTPNLTHMYNHCVLQPDQDMDMHCLAPCINPKAWMAAEKARFDEILAMTGIQNVLQ
jgi:hypothetical protein